MRLDVTLSINYVDFNVKKSFAEMKILEFAKSIIQANRKFQVLKLNKALIR